MILRRIKAWTPAALVAGLIFYLSSQPTFGITFVGWVSEVVSTIAHFVEFGFLAAAISHGLKSEGMDGEDARKMAVLLAFAFGVTDEIHQMFTPGRSPSPLDLIPDVLGAWVGVRLFGAATRRWGKQKEKEV